ncbi:MAG: M14 family zinc carboxypeptidase [Promethearchaeota archaeon]
MRNKLSYFILFLLLALPLITTQIQVFSIGTFYIVQEGKNNQIVRDWSSISLIYPDKYHTPNQLIEELLQMNNTAPEIIDLYSIGKSIEGRDIFCLRATNEQNVIPKAGVLFVAHHHAREQITIEMILRFMLILVNNYRINEDITEYIDNLDIYFIPTLNPDGLYYSLGNDFVQGNPWFRKNLRDFDDDKDGRFNEDPPEDTNGDGLISEFEVVNKITDKIVDVYLEGIDNDGDSRINEDPLGGVDLNRNYNYRWNDPACQSGSSDKTTSADYPGTDAFSEPETRAYQNFVEDKRFATAISLHSGINATYFPWASEGYWTEGPLYNKIRSDLYTILPNGYITEQEASLATYTTCAGEWGDFMYAKRDCLVPMTFEIYHNVSSESEYQFVSSNDTHEIWRWDGIFGYFNPEEAAIHAVWEDIQGIFIYWLCLNPRLKPSVKSITGGTNLSDSLEIKLSIESLSPYIGSIDELKVLKTDFSFIEDKGSPVTIPAIPAGKVVERSFEFKLEEELSIGTNLTLFIGNDYVGFSSIVIEANEIKAAQNVSISFFSSLLAILAVTMQKYFKSKRNTFY